MVLRKNSSGVVFGKFEWFRFGQNSSGVVLSQNRVVYVLDKTALVSFAVKIPVAKFGVIDLSAVVFLRIES
jgi:hypothetical protein